MSPPAQPLQILMIAADEADASLVGASLAEAGQGWFKLTREARLGDALRKLEIETFNIIILVWGARGMSMGAIESLRAAAPVSALAVLLNAGDSQAEFGLRAARAGAQVSMLLGEIRGPALKRLLQSVTVSHEAQALAEMQEKLRRQELEKLLHIDELTGLSNAPYFAERTDKEILRSMRYKNKLTIGVFKIDQFEAIRKEHGEQAATAVLQLAGQALRRILRSIDEVGRLKGSAFAALWLETGMIHAQVAAGRVANELNSRTTAMVQGKPMTVSLSVGLAEWTPAANNAEDLIRLAAAAADEASMAGGDRIVCHGLGRPEGQRR